MISEDMICYFNNIFCTCFFFFVFFHRNISIPISLPQPLDHSRNNKRMRKLLLKWLNKGVTKDTKVIKISNVLTFSRMKHKAANLKLPISPRSSFEPKMLILVLPPSLEKKCIKIYTCIKNAFFLFT